MNWIDATSWSRRDDEEARKTPRTWEARVGVLQLVVTRHIHLAPTDWLLRCTGLNIESNVANVSAEIAQKRLVELVTKRLRDALRNIGETP